MIDRHTYLLGLAMQTILQNELRLPINDRGSKRWIAQEAHAIVNAILSINTFDKPASTIGAYSN